MRERPSVEIGVLALRVPAADGGFGERVGQALGDRLTELPVRRLELGAVHVRVAGPAAAEAIADAIARAIGRASDA